MLLQLWLVVVVVSLVSGQRENIRVTSPHLASPSRALERGAMGVANEAAIRVLNKQGKKR